MQFTTINDGATCQILKKIVAKLTSDPVLQQDLMQECHIRLWRLSTEKPGQTRSWYLQNCRFHLQHWLASGRSLDSLKRAGGDNRVSIDGIIDELPLYGYHTNGELMDAVCARDIVTTLSHHLNPSETAVLTGLAEGLVLQDISQRLNISYPTTLKYRRRIASITVKLGIATPPPQKRNGNGSNHFHPGSTLPASSSACARINAGDSLPPNSSKDVTQAR